MWIAVVRASELNLLEEVKHQSPCHTISTHFVVIKFAKYLKEKLTTFLRITLNMRFYELVLSTSIGEPLYL